MLVDSTSWWRRRSVWPAWFEFWFTHSTYTASRSFSTISSFSTSDATHCCCTASACLHSRNRTWHGGEKFPENPTIKIADFDRHHMQNGVPEPEASVDGNADKHCSSLKRKANGILCTHQWEAAARTVVMMPLITVKSSKEAQQALDLWETIQSCQCCQISL